jgi:tyrosyl-tRNA synthetase
LMWSYYELVTDHTPQQIAELKQQVESGGLHPMDAKMKLAEEVVSGFQGAEAGHKAAENFQRVFRDRQAPEEMREIRLQRAPGGLVGSLSTRPNIVETISILLPSGSEKWSKILAALGEIDSTSKAEQLIKQGGLEINGSILKDPAARLNPGDAASFEIRLGKKKFFRLVVE